jgi:hypothetical protein
VGFVQNARGQRVYQSAYFGAAGPPVSTPEAQAEGASHIIVFPNPTQTEFTVISDKERLEGYSLVNALGQVAIEGPIRGLRATIPVGDLPVGTYFLRLSTKDGTVSKQVMILR